MEMCVRTVRGRIAYTPEIGFSVAEEAHDQTESPHLDLKFAAIYKKFKVDCHISPALFSKDNHHIHKANLSRPVLNYLGSLKSLTSQTAGP